MSLNLEFTREIVARLLDAVRPGWREGLRGDARLLDGAEGASSARMDLILDVLSAASAEGLIREEPPSLGQLSRWALEVQTLEDLNKLVFRLAKAHEQRDRRRRQAASRRSSPEDDSEPMARRAALGPVRINELAAERPSLADARAQTRGGEDELVVDIHYVTDRAAAPDSRLGLKFGGLRAHCLTYGECTVSLPRQRVKGTLPRPRWWRLEFVSRPGDHAILRQVRGLDETGFYGRLGARVAESAGREALVFVHGFNVTFENAALRTAQIAVDLAFDGAPILYSWPARGNVLDYVRDANSVDASAAHFLQFLAEVAERSGAEAVHVIAHSMGNRALCQALHLLSQRGPAALSARIGHVVLAAPDMDAPKLEQIGEELRRTARSMTLYASSRDLALRLSKRVHGGRRAGEPIIVLPDVDSIDASDVDTDFLAHGYFSEGPSVLTDLRELLGGRPAKDRETLESAGELPLPHYRVKV